MAGRAAHLDAQRDASRRIDDVRVRQAINYAVDKEAFLATVYKGTAAQGRRRR